MMGLPVMPKDDWFPNPLDSMPIARDEPLDTSPSEIQPPGVDEEEEEIWNESQTISGGEFLDWWEVLNEEEKLAWTSAKEKAKLSSQDKLC